MAHLTRILLVATLLWIAYELHSLDATLNAVSADLIAIRSTLAVTGR